MVHPTPALINPLAFGIGHAGPAAVWCTRTSRFRPIVKPADADADLEPVASGSSASAASATARGVGLVQRTVKQQQTYTLPPTPLSGQRQKQLNNTIPVVPPSTTPSGSVNNTTTGKKSKPESSVPAPTVFWNDHLRMI